MYSYNKLQNYLKWVDYIKHQGHIKQLWALLLWQVYRKVSPLFHVYPKDDCAWSVPCLTLIFNAKILAVQIRIS